MFLKRIITYSILTLIALGGFFGNVDIDPQGNKDTYIHTISFEGNNVYADDWANTPDGKAPATDPKKDTTSSASVTMYNNLIGSINIILAVLSAMISPIILLVGWLMSPDWTSGDIFGLRAPMYALWVTVSNIVYFIYAILLILIALGTMFGQDKFSYKVMLPKLALGILMVPFTWWFVQWTVSIASVVTASVMTIPAETIANNDSTWFTTPSIPQVIIVNNIGTGAQTTKVNCKESGGAGCISPKEFLGKSGGMYGPLIVYGYSIFKFEEIKELKTGLDIASAALQIVHTSIISTIMFAVFGLLTIALATMLLVRAMKLWMYAIFAPLFTFRFVAGSNLMGGDDDSFSIKEFIGLAFVPAIVGLTLSFGLIIINAVQGPGSTNPNRTSSTTCDLKSDAGCSILSIFGSADNKITRKIELPDTPEAYTNTKFEFGSIQFYFFGKATNQTNTNSNAPGAIDALGGMFGTLIIDVIALVFIWMAFMAAKNVSKAVKMAVQPFEDIGNKIGGLAKSIPKYTPIPGLGMSANSMGKVVTNAENAMIGASDKKFKESAAGKLFGGERVVATVDEKKLSDAMNAVGKNYNDKANLKIMGDQIEKQSPNADIENSSMFKNVAELVKKIDGRTNKEELLKNMGYSSENAGKIVEQLGKKTNGEFDKNDITLLAALKSRIGTPAGGTGAASHGTTSAAATGNGVISINGVNINYNGIDLKATPTQIGEKVATYLNAKKTDMEKPTEDQIKKLVESLGVDALKEVETVKKIVEKLDGSGYKAKP